MIHSLDLCNYLYLQILWNLKGAVVLFSDWLFLGLAEIVTSTTEGEGGCVFTPLCLFVCVQDISKSCGRIRMIFCGKVACDMKELITFFEDPNPDPDLIISVILHH